MTTSPALLTAAQALLHEADAIAAAVLADAQGGEPALDVAGLVSAQRRLLSMLGAQLGELEGAARQLTRPTPTPKADARGLRSTQGGRSSGAA